MCHNQRLFKVQCSRLQVASAWPTELVLMSLGRTVLRLDSRFFSFGDFPEPRRLAWRCYCPWRHCFPSGTLTKEHPSADDCTEHPGRAFIPFRSRRLVVDSTTIHSFVMSSKKVTANVVGTLGERTGKEDHYYDDDYFALEAFDMTPIIVHGSFSSPG